MSSEKTPDKLTFYNISENYDLTIGDLPDILSLWIEKYNQLLKLKNKQKMKNQQKIRQETIKFSKITTKW